MKILVFSDLHANRNALKEISQLIKRADLSIFCGDVVGYGKDISYCIDFVSRNVDIVVLGNHDRLAITNESLKNQNPIVKESTIFLRNQLSEDQKDWLLSLPKEVWFENFYITHSLGDDYLCNANDMKRLCKKMHQGISYALFGHTHKQVLFQYRNKNIINPGSIAKGRKGLDRGFVIINNDKIEFIKLENIL